ncbi:MAG: sn-glycerol-3-phosphate ABC transporter ATP-binding protein UgpC [bacterium]
MAEVVLENVCKRYENGALAVDRFNLVIESGEFLVLVGPSGCGKSTTLRMIAGLEDITSGIISIGGRCVNTVPPKDRDIAMVFQNYALYPHMTVFDNMAFGLKLRNVPKHEIAERVREAVSILGLGELMQRFPKQLSGGQRQRVAVGRAIVRKPKVFLFDEPLSNLDAKMRVEMRSEISRLHRRLDATMVYVTHDQVEAMTMGDRIVVMDCGAIQQAATPLAVYQRPANLFVAGFIGTPPMNFLKGRVIRQGRGCLFRHATGEVSLPERSARALELFAEREVLLGFRPEALGGARGGAVVRGTVDVVEPMGADTYVQVVAEDGTRVTARVGADRVFVPGTPVELPVDMANALFFDVTSGRVIGDE